MARKPGQVVFADRNGMGAGKGDYPRNISAQFKSNFEKLDFSKANDCPECKHVLCTCK